MTSATAAVVDEQCYSARTFIRRASFTFARARSAYPTRNDGSRRGMDRRAGEGRAKRRHCARHGEHRPGARGPRDRRDVWDRKTPRFRPCRVSAASIGRAGWTDDRATRAVPALGANSTDRARPSNLAGWTSPEKTITLASLVAPRLVRRVASKSVASSEARVQPGGTDCSDPSRNPHPTRDARATAASFSSKNPPERLPARRVASRDAPSPPDRARPREPPVKLHMSLLCRPFVFSSSSSSARSTAPILARLPAISVCSATRVRRARLFFFFFFRGASARSARARAPTLHPRDAHRPFPLRSLSSGPPR